MKYEADESHQAVDVDVYYLRAAVKAGVLGVRGTHCAGPSLAQMSPCMYSYALLPSSSNPCKLVLFSWLT